MSFVVQINDMNALLESWARLLATASGSQVFTWNEEVLQTLNEWPRIKWFYYCDNADGNTIRIYDTEHFAHFGGSHYLERDDRQRKEHFERVILRGKNMWADNEANLSRPQSLRNRFRFNPAWVIFSAREAPIRPGSSPAAELRWPGRRRNPFTVDVESRPEDGRERRLWYFESLNQLPVFNPPRQGLQSSVPGASMGFGKLVKVFRPGPVAPVELVPAPAPTPAELRSMPRQQRQAILAAAAELAEQDYRSDKELTGFEAFSEEELDAD